MNKKLYEEGLAVRREVLGGDYVDRAKRRLRAGCLEIGRGFGQKSGSNPRGRKRRFARSMPPWPLFRVRNDTARRLFTRLKNFS